MFTIEQVQAAHAKVKSGADFPKYVQDIKHLGVSVYEHYVSDGHIQYYGINNFTISSDAKYTPIEIAAFADAVLLLHIISIHQKGQTDYLTFCRQSAEAGVEKWTVDIAQMACIYYDTAGNEMVVEPIPMS